ncbi:hypothetical protein [Vibrio phage JSF5]|nr:hypothetical protein [Vibrio phage JSF5]
MKKLITSLILGMTLTSFNASSYTIGGEYARLISCGLGSYGYEYGYIGLYKTSRGAYYTIFFGDSYCEY